MSRHGPGPVAGRSCLPDGQSPLATVVSSAVTTGTLLVAFTLLALDVEQFWVTFVVGFGVVLPTALAAVRATEADGEETTRHTGPRAELHTESGTAQALEDLRERYARGEMGDEEFERRLERVLERESRADSPDSGVGSSLSP